MDLSTFRLTVTSLMEEQTERPFVCDGSPLRARVFVVGLNPATTLQREFWDFWSDISGFDRSRFDRAYGATRPVKRGNRPRIEAIAAAFEKGTVLETNIHASPTKSAQQLVKSQKRTRVFEFLSETIKPQGLFVHGAPTVSYFSTLAPELVSAPDDVPVETRLWGRDVVIMLRRRRALYTASIEEARALGRMLARSCPPRE